ncbi:MAG: YceI family protein [Massilia sp.]|nr:YceI family protein [Massilia sp.]
MRRVLALASLSAALLAGCVGTPTMQPAPAAVTAVDDNAATWYGQAAAAGSVVLAIDPAQSLIAVTVRRGGALAHLGHDHVVASRSVTGFVAPAAGRADFSFRLDQMTVDEPELRREAALDTQPSDAAIAGTRTNMLTKVLEAERFALVALHAEGVATDNRAGDPAGDQAMRLTITLHGVTCTLAAPTRIERSADGITASGTLQLRQSDFGITRLSVMGGAIAVLDTMELRFRIVARTMR